MKARSGLLFALLCMTILGCGKNKYDNDASALWNFKIETTFDEITNISDQALMREFKLLLGTKSDLNLRNNLVDENNKLSILLVNSWLKLIKH